MCESRPDSEHGKVAKAAGVVGLATLLSRIFGFIRDVVVAKFFGAGMATDAFFVAFRIPNMLRRLLAEGSLTVSFVPVFTEYLNRRTRRDALDLANTAFTLLSVLLVLISIAGVLLAPFIVTIMAPGFRAAPEKYALTVFLTRLMFPYIFFISLVALCMGVLNSLRHFATPALSPVLLNISMIGAALWLRDYFAEPVVALAAGVLIGGLLQLGMQLPVLYRMGVRPAFRFDPGHPGIRRIGALMVPAAFGAAVYQINVFIGTLLASFLPGGSVSYLYYADRIVELPLGVFGIAVGTASLPSLSEQVSRGAMEEMKRTLAFSLRLITFIAVPATAALIVLKLPIISVLFQRGEFGLQSAVLTAQALFYYSLGLWFFSAIRVVISAFYSLQDTRTPVQVGIAALAINTLLSVLLMFPLRHGGLALATSLASAFNVALLYWLLTRRIGVFLDRGFFQSLARICLSSLLMLAAIYLADWAFPWRAEAGFSERLWSLLLQIVAGGAVFLAAAYGLKSPELMVVVGSVRKRISGGRG